MSEQTHVIRSYAVTAYDQIILFSMTSLSDVIENKIILPKHFKHYH